MNPVAGASGALGGFGMFAPGLSSVKQTDPGDPSAVASVRTGECFGLSWSFVVAALLAYHEGSWELLGYWALGAAALVALWEYHLRQQAA